MIAPSKLHLLGLVVGLFQATGLVTRTGAEQIAELGGRVIVMIHSGQTSWEGMNDTSSLDEAITAVGAALLR